MPSRVMRTTALTSTTRTAVTASDTAEFPNSVLTIPAGQGGTLKQIIAMPLGTLETGVLGAGGLVELDNDARKDWYPMKFYTRHVPQELTATSGGAVFVKPTVIDCNLPLPDNSNITVYVTNFDDQSQAWEFTFVWTVGGFSGKLTHYDSAKSASALTQITKAESHITFTMPAQGGGWLTEVSAYGMAGALVVVGTDPNIGGGRFIVRNTSANNGAGYPDTQFSTGAPSLLVAGAVVIDAHIEKMSHPLPANSVLRFDYQPYNDGSQSAYVTIKYER